MRKSLSYNQRFLINLLKERHRGFFWPFQSWLLGHVECYIFWENHTEISIWHFLSFSLFGYKWHADKFLKTRVK